MDGWEGQLVSLNKSQRAATHDELQANLALSGLSALSISTDLGLDASRVRAALDVTGARPADVWLVRDYLDRLIRSAGATPRAYSSLTEQNRTAAQAWFSLSDIDDVLKQVSQ